MNLKFLYALLLLGLNSFFYSQNFDSKRKYLDSIVTKADTIFLVLTNSINYAQAEVPIYNFDIDKSKFKRYKSNLFDTLKDGRAIYKDLPQIYNTNKTTPKKIKKEILQFESAWFGINSRSNILNNNEVIGYEKRVCLNVKNSLSEKKCIEKIYDVVFYHAKISKKYLEKYIDYIKYRNENHKSYNVRYSGYSPNVESGSVNSIQKKGLSVGNNNALFLVSDLSIEKQNSQKNIITLPYIKSILREGKIYFMRAESSVEQDEKQLFEEVKYQKYVTD